MKEAADEDEGSSNENTPMGKPEQLHSLSNISSRVPIAAKVNAIIIKKKIYGQFSYFFFFFFFLPILLCVSVVESSEADHVEYPPQ